MTKFNIFSLGMLGLVAMPFLSMAQTKMGAWPNTNDPTNNNYYIDYVGGRVIINSPANIKGPVTHTISNDGKGTGDWGGSIQGLGSPIQDVEIVKADPYDACVGSNPLTNASAINGKIALVKRGTCEFGSKAKAAQAAGAKAVIIVNNVTGSPVGMGAGNDGGAVTIPVIMVSDVDGAAIEAEIVANNSPKMTMTTWSNGYNNDIGIVDRGLSLWHAYSMPLNQVKGATSIPYKAFNGVVIGNFGTSTSGPIKVKSTLSWTPTGGTTSVVRADSMMTSGAFNAADSIITPFIDAEYNLNPTTTGRYDVLYEVTPSFTDQSPGDNIAKYSFYIDNQVASKGRYDFATGRPSSSVGYRLGTPAEFTWGPMMYMEKDKYVFENVKFSMSKENAQTDNSMASFGTVQILIFKWADANGDTIMNPSELSIVGLGSKTFVSGDTSGQVHAVNIKDINGVNPVATEANTWYWVAAAVPSGPFMAVDGISNYFVRSWGRAHATNRTREPYAPLFPENFQNLGSSTNPPQHYPFESYFWLEDSIRFSQQKNGLLPSMPVQMSLFTIDVKNVEPKNAFNVSLYPNPAIDVVNVDVDFGKEASNINYTVLSAVGARIKDETRNNLSTDKYSISTAELAAGTYYLVIDADGTSMLRQFSVIK